MSAIVFILGLATVLFAAAFFSKRRFGILGLALAAGALISANWTSTVTPLLEQQGVVLLSPPLSAVVATVLTVLPAALLMFSGPKYSDTFSRIAGSVAFAVLAVAFLIEPLAFGLHVDSTASKALDFMQEAQSIVVVSGLIAAVTDVMLYKPPKDKDKKK